MTINQKGQTEKKRKRKKRNTIFVCFIHCELFLKADPFDARTAEETTTNEHSLRRRQRAYSSSDFKSAATAQVSLILLHS